MATIKTIKPDGTGDYTTLALWWAWAKTQATADQWAEVYSGGSVGTLTMTAFDTAVTSATEYPKIYAADGHKHIGAIPTDTDDVAYSGEIYIYDSYTEVDGMFIMDFGRCINVKASIKPWTVQNCLIKSVGTSSNSVVYWANWSGSSASGCILINNIIFVEQEIDDATESICYLGGNNNYKATIYNNTIISEYDRIGILLRGSGTDSWNSVSGDIHNNAVFVGSGGSCYGESTTGTWIGTASNNASSDGTATSILGGTNNKDTLDIDDQFTDSSSDCNLLHTSDLKGNGTTTYSSTDAVGNTWNNPTSIGALESILTGSGTLLDPYIIMDSPDLYSVRNNLTAYYKLNNNIDLSSYGDWSPYSLSITEGWVGDFNGNGYKIIGLSVPSGNYSSMFGTLTGGTIYDLALEDVDINGGLYIGALVGRALTGTIERCYSTGSVIASSSSSGGLVGMSAITITDCFSTVDVEGTGTNRISGVVGRSGTAIRSYFVGSILTNNEPTFYGNAVSEGTNTDCYYDITVNPNVTAVGASGENTAAMKTDSTFTGWDFTDTWVINSSYNNGYPYLKVFIKDVIVSGIAEILGIGFSNISDVSNVSSSNLASVLSVDN